MLTKFKLCFPLLMILAMVTVALPTRSVTAMGMASQAAPQIINGSCSVKKLVDIEGEFSTVVSTSPYSPTAFRVSYFGFGSLFINHRLVGGLTFGSQIVNAAVVPNPIDGNLNLLTTDGSLIFGEFVGAATLPDAAGNLTFSGEILFFGGTRTHLGAKGEARVVGTANVLTSKGHVTFEGHIRTNVAAPCPR